MDDNEHEHRTFNLGTFRAFLAELGPEGRRNLTVVLVWFIIMLAAAMASGFAIGRLI